MYQNLLNSADRNKNAVFRHGVYVEIKTILAFLTTFSMWQPYLMTYMPVPVA